MKVKVGISNRHVHLTEDTYNYLFDKKKIEIRNNLNQIGEFASTDTVSLKYGDKVIEHVRLVGPFRSKNQIELLRSDLEYLGLDAPTRRSGNLEGTPVIEILVGSKKVLSDGVIRAEKHVHVPTSEEEKLGLHEREVVKVICPKAVFFANVKVSDNGYFELHIDKDEAEEYSLEANQEVEITKEF